MSAVLADPLLQLTVLVGLAVLFAGTATHKLRDLAQFRATLGAYRIMPERVVPLVAAAVVLTELTLAGALLVPATSRMAALGGTALLGLYAGAIAVNLWRGRRDIDCGCGGPGARQPISEWLVARNLVLGAAALLTLVPVQARVLVWLDWLTLVATVAVFAFAWEAVHRLLAEWERMRPHLHTATETE